jgi:hypothetical protein
MTKIISASAILKQKGFVQKKFDTSGFMNAVAQYFLKNQISSHLYLFEFSFVEFPDCDSEEELQDEYNRCSVFRVFNADKEVGWKAECDFNEDGNLVYATQYPYTTVMDMRDMGILLPRILIDKPFFKNAAEMLRLMGGYVVEKKKIKRYINAYDVSLI